LEINIPRGETAILFAILFVIGGFVTPIMYVDLAPDSHFVEVHEFDVSDTHVDADSHIVCFDRTVHKPSDADITVEMVLLKDDGSIVEKDSFAIDAYYQTGRQNVKIERKLRTDSLEEGSYRYVHFVTLSYYNNKATKNFKFESDEFTIYDSKEELEVKSNSSC